MSFADPTEPARILGVAPSDPRLVLALETAERYVQLRTGIDPATVDPSTAPSGPHSATVAASVRFYKGPDVPFGLAGTDLTSYVSRTMSEVDLALVGHRLDWGIA